MTVQWMVVGALFESTAALEEEEVALDPTSLTPCYIEQERTGYKANQKFKWALVIRIWETQIQEKPEMCS